MFIQLLTLSLCVAQSATLEVGDPAPPLSVTHWITEEAVTEFRKGEVYVVELWATWCGPCIVAMDHLSTIQERLGDHGVTVIAISNESLPTIVRFLGSKDQQEKYLRYDRIGFALGADPDESVWRDYYEAAMCEGLPASFIVGKEGFIEWMGHPKDLDGPLEAVMEDRWDRDRYRASTAALRERRRKHRDAVIRFNQFAGAKDWEGAVAALEERILLDPNDTPAEVTAFFYLADPQCLGDYERAFAFVDRLTRARWNDVRTLQHWAWRLATDERIEVKDIALATKLADRLEELTQGRNPYALDAIASVRALEGDLKSACQCERKAVDLLKERDESEPVAPSLKEFERRLADYERLLRLRSR